MEISFEHLFRELILQRGYSYFINDLVKKLKIVDNKITAKVIGSEEYSVEILINNNDIENLYCDCLYFESGDNCKHLAAALYASCEMGDEKTKLIYEDTEIEPITDLLNSLSYEDLHEFLKDELMQNNDLKFKFRAKFQKNSSVKDITWYLGHINSVMDNHLGYNHFIHYNAIPAFEQDMDEIINTIDGLIRDEEYGIAFEMIKQIIVRIGDLDIDDSFGTTSCIMNDLVELLTNIICNDSNIIYNQIFEWLCNMLGGKILDYLEEELICVFMEYYNDENKLTKKIEIIDHIILDIKDTKSWSGEWKLTKWIQNKIALLDEAQNIDEVDHVLQSYIYLSGIRNIRIERYIQNKDYESAIALLVEGKMLYSDKLGIVNDYSSKLIEIYQTTGKKEKIYEESRIRLFNYSPRSLESYRDYKNLYSSKEWEQERYIVLEQLKKTSCDMKIYYAEEKMMTQLLFEIKASPSLNGLDTYEKMLYGIFTYELLELFVKRVIKMAKHTGGRKHYRDIVQELKHIIKYPKGKELVENLVVDWSKQYKNRTAMMDELRKSELI